MFNLDSEKDFDNNIYYYILSVPEQGCTRFMYNKSPAKGINFTLIK